VGGEKEREREDVEMVTREKQRKKDRENEIGTR
jgi:hypothetical protein